MYSHPLTPEKYRTLVTVVSTPVLRNRIVMKPDLCRYTSEGCMHRSITPIPVVTPVASTATHSFTRTHRLVHLVYHRQSRVHSKLIFRTKFIQDKNHACTEFEPINYYLLATAFIVNHFRSRSLIEKS